MLDLLVNYINDDDSTNDDLEKIYTDFNFEHLSIVYDDSQAESGSRVKQSQNSDIRQKHFETEVKLAVDAIIAEATMDQHPYFKHLEEIAALGDDIRPRVLDSVSGQKVLVDSGSQVTAWPKAEYPDAKVDTNCQLKAVNKSKIITYGTVVRQIRIGRKTYNKRDL